MRAVKRVERPPVVLYVERDRLGSFLCLWMACLLLPVAGAVWSQPILGILAVHGVVILGVGAFVLLFRARVMAIDRDLGELRVLDRRVPWRTWRYQIALHRVRIRLQPRNAPAQGHELCVLLPDGATILVKRGGPLTALRRLAGQLAADAGRPLDTA
jgi:hypothetical protein